MLTRRAPMKRSAWPAKVPRREATQSTYTPRPREPVRALCVQRAEPVRMPKPEPCRPGKRAPTVAEREWMAAITAMGCIACWLDGNPGRPAAVHHLLRGGRRIGHLHSIPLCDPGHHQSGQPLGLLSRHPWKAQFEHRYGTEAELLRMCQQRVAGVSVSPADVRAWRRETACSPAPILE